MTPLSGALGGGRLRDGDRGSEEAFMTEVIMKNFIEDFGLL